jgi:CheY-like chemotaxis protein
VVDQDPDRLLAIGHLLHDRGYVVLGTTDPEEALAVVELGPVSLLLIDVNLAGPASGNLLARLERRGCIPTVVVGARSRDRREPHVSAYLGTPIGPRRLLRVVRRLVGPALAA